MKKFLVLFLVVAIMNINACATMGAEKSSENKGGKNTSLSDMMGMISEIKIAYKENYGSDLKDLESFINLAGINNWPSEANNFDSFENIEKISKGVKIEDLEKLIDIITLKMFYDGKITGKGNLVNTSRTETIKVEIKKVGSNLLPKNYIIEKNSSKKDEILSPGNYEATTYVVVDGKLRQTNIYDFKVNFRTYTSGDSKVYWGIRYIPAN